MLIIPAGEFKKNDWYGNPPSPPALMSPELSNPDPSFCDSLESVILCVLMLKLLESITAYISIINPKVFHQLKVKVSSFSRTYLLVPGL